MNYNKLYYFYQIAKKLNLTHAAEQLHISQPSLSKAVKDLESELNVTLFYRTNRSLELTSAGETLFQACADFFGGEAEIVQRVQRKAANKVAHLRFGYMTFNLIYQIPGFLERFRKSHPDIQVSANSYIERTDINEDIICNRLDVGLKLFTTDEIIPALGFQVLEEHHMSVIVSANHPLAKCSRVNLHDLAEENFVFLGIDDKSSEYRFAENWCSRCGFVPRITEKFNRVESVLMMVQSNAGIALLSDFAPFESAKNLVSIPLNNAPIIYSGLFWNRNSFRPEAKTFVEDFLREIKN